MKECADDNFKFDDNGRKFFKLVENTVGKEKFLITSNFYFSHSVFKRLIMQTSKNQGLFGKELIVALTIYNINLSFDDPVKAFENMGGENAGS